MVGNSTGYIKINSDEWEDAGKVYKVLEYYRRDPANSSAVELTLQVGEQKIKRVVPYHWVEWIEDGDW